MPREQLLSYFVPPDQLQAMWETIVQTVSLPGLQQFKDVRLLLNAKNLKTLTKGRTWGDMVGCFQRYWTRGVNEAYISANIFYDIGKETCPRQTYLPTCNTDGCMAAQTLLWKRCCLDSYHDWFRSREPKSPCKTEFYPRAMLGETASMGIETSAQSGERAQGLLYSQFYASVKEVFAAGNQYPFRNMATETLGLDGKLRKMWQQVGGGLSHDPVALIKGYLHAKGRCHNALQGSVRKSFGVREEHRVSRGLFGRIGGEFLTRRLDGRRMQSQSLVEDERPYFTHGSDTIMGWFRWNINKFCAGFETVYSMNDSHFVTWEHTRMMLMFLRCLRLSYGTGRMRESAGCWHDVRYEANSDEANGLRRMEGLGFGKTMFRYGYAWFLDKIDWASMTFKQPHSRHMLFNNPSMQKAYRARYGQIRDAREDFIRVSKVHGWMEEFSSVAASLDFLEDYLRQLCMRAFRKDVFTYIKQMLKRNRSEEALGGNVALCYDAVQSVVKAKHRPLHLVTGNRLSVKSIEVLFAWLWEWRDKFERKGWGGKPYRMLYQSSFEIVSLIRGKACGREWKRRLKSSFIKTHWLLPYPQKARFMRKQAGCQQVSWWSSYHGGVDAYYQQLDEQEGLVHPLPTSEADHYPVSGWNLSGQYMRHEILPEDGLLGLSEEDIYEHLGQLWRDHEQRGDIERSASQELGGEKMEIFSVERQERFRLKKTGRRFEDEEIEGQWRRSTGRISRSEQKLEVAKEEYERLQHGCRGRGTRVGDSERREAREEMDADVTSDEESLHYRERRQAEVVREKEDELRQVLEEERRVQNCCKNIARRRWKERQRAAIREEEKQKILRRDRRARAIGIELRAIGKAYDVELPSKRRARAKDSRD